MGEPPTPTMPRTLPAPLPFGVLDLAPDAAEARFRWAQAQGHPAYLWPDVPVQAWRRALASIERATACVLIRSGGRVCLEVPATSGARALGIAAFTSGMGPLLGSWIESGRLEADGEIAALFLLHLAHGRRRAARVERELASILDLFAAAGIRTTVLKGAHTGRAYFPEPGTRPMSDIDLYVPGHADAAAGALSAAGYEIKERQPRIRRSAWARPGEPTLPRSLELAHADDPFTIELHESLDRHFFGVRSVRVDATDATSIRPWTELHPTAYVLAQPDLITFLAAHASERLTSAPLLRLTELVLIVRADLAAGRLRWEELASRLRETGAARFVYPALELAERLAPGTLDAGFRAMLASAATRRMVRSLESLGPSGVQRLDRLSIDERFMWPAGPLEYLRAVLDMFLPASVPPSWRKVRDLYLERVRRVVRRRVTWRGRR